MFSHSVADRGVWGRHGCLQLEGVALAVLITEEAASLQAILTG